MIVSLLASVLCVQGSRLEGWKVYETEANRYASGDQKPTLYKTKVQQTSSNLTIEGDDYDYRWLTILPWKDIDRVEFVWSQFDILEGEPDSWFDKKVKRGDYRSWFVLHARGKRIILLSPNKRESTKFLSLLVPVLPDSALKLPKPMPAFLSHIRPSNDPANALSRSRSSAQYLSLGQQAYRAGNLGDAETHLKKSFELNPKEGRAAYLLGRVHKDMGRFTAAIDLLSRASDLLPENSTWQKNTYYFLAQMHRDQNNKNEAISAYRKLLTLSPDHERAVQYLHSLTSLSAENGDFDEALKYARLWGAREPDNLDVRDLVNKLLLLVGQGPRLEAELGAETRESMIEELMARLSAASRAEDSGKSRTLDETANRRLVNLMDAAEYSACGLQKLAASEIQELEAWIRSVRGGDGEVQILHAMKVSTFRAAGLVRLEESELSALEDWINDRLLQ